jgi:diaminopimelate epimerase
MQLWKAHGLGNDYLLLEDGPALTPAVVRKVCHRHTGVGGDGILEPTATDHADHGVRIWNPDGSVAEKSGNGLRIFARWLSDHRAAGTAFTVHTGFERVSCEVGAHDVAVEMGLARFDAEHVPVDRARLDAPIEADGDPLLAVAVGVGNPHCVVFRTEDLDHLPWRRWGAALEVHPAFPNRTNVQFARVLGPDRVAIRIWERGAGETSASGSSSCATAAAAVRTGRLQPGLIRVEMPGGTLQVTVRDDWSLLLRGPVEPVGRVVLDPAWLP